MSADAPSRRSLLGLAGVASLCCVGPGAAAVTGGTTVGLVGGLVQGVLVFVVLGILGLLFRLRLNCSRSQSCSSRTSNETERDAHHPSNAD